MSQPDVVLCTPVRTAIGTYGGSLKASPVPELGAIVIREVVARSGLDPAAVDGVTMGNVIQAGNGMNPARQCAVDGGIPVCVPAMTVNRVCGSGAQAVASAASEILAGQADCAIAGGAENMDMAPYLAPGGRWGYRLGDGSLLDSMLRDGLNDAFSGRHSGWHTEDLVEARQITREDQDAWAARSQKRFSDAQAAGSFDDEIVAVPLAGRKGPASFDRDEHNRPETTADSLARLGASYIGNIVLDEATRFAARSDETTATAVELVERRAFNPNGTGMWFSAVVALLDQLSMLTIILTGAALLREREHGTIEHLMVMPLTAFQIAMAKVWANGLIILVAFTLSLLIVVETILQVPVAGSRWLLIGGTTVYLFAAAAIGIFLGTVARTMAQFALLIMMTIIPMIMLSGGMTPIESQPDIVRPITWLLPSRHFMAFAQAVVFRGAGLDTVWPQFLTVAGLGAVFFVSSLALFRRSITARG